MSFKKKLLKHSANCSIFNTKTILESSIHILFYLFIYFNLFYAPFTYLGQFYMYFTFIHGQISIIYVFYFLFMEKLQS